jgi:hypothetical protein
VEKIDLDAGRGRSGTHIRDLIIITLHVEVLISLWLFLFPTFLFAAQQKEFFLDGLKKSER